MKAWAVRNKHTGLFIPWGGRNRSNSWEEATSLDKPRLLCSKRSAQNMLTSWLQGRWLTHSERSGMFGEETDYYVAPHQTENKRNREDMEVVEFDLTEVIA